MTNVPDIELSPVLDPARMEDIKWWHQIALPDGRVTPGYDRSDSKLAELHLPSLEGKTVLDVGAWDGYFSFTAERMGASRVVALDTFAWRKPGGKEGFEYARRALGSSVEDIEVEVLDISPETVGRFDVVLFLGVLYHMRHPLLSLERVSSVADELLVVETLADMSYIRSPAAAFYPDSLLHDQTNWWGPNRAALVGMLHSVGCTRVTPYAKKRIARERVQNLPDQLKTATEWMMKTPRGSRLRLMRDFARSAVAQNRLVAHGWK
jgi:tRNA (mo5U34)-methyltransferase